MEATQKLANTDDAVVSTSATEAMLSFRYNSDTRTYTVSSGPDSATFGPGDLRQVDVGGDSIYGHDSGNDYEFLTLFNPARIAGGARYVSAGIWQRRDVFTSDSSDFTFNVFVFGYPTAPGSIPVSGSATYDVDLFGVASPLGTFPRSVIGDGTFQVDFAQGLFSLSGQAGEYNNDVDYSTCCASWRGAGYLGSSGLLSGYFSYDGRNRYTYQATIEGGFFGPSGQEVGAVLLGGDASGDASFTGIFAGTRLGPGLDSPLSVIGGSPGTYYSTHGVVAVAQEPGATNSLSTATYFPARFGKLVIGADGSLTLVANISDPSFTNVSFTPADRVQAESDGRFDVYRVQNTNGDYRLQMFKPGPANPEMQLTYSSFGRWDEERAIGPFSRQSIAVWFSYGVRTGLYSLPTSGSAHYRATILGSGERYQDAEALRLQGEASIDVDFEAMRVEGAFDADAWTTMDEFIDVPVMAFDTYLGNGYGFEAFLQDTPGHSPGFIQGQLYGPAGEEIGGTFDFFTRVTPGGQVDASYGGVFYGKRD